MGNTIYKFYCDDLNGHHKQVLCTSIIDLYFAAHLIAPNNMKCFNLFSGVTKRNDVHYVVADETNYKREIPNDLVDNWHEECGAFSTTSCVKARKDFFEKFKQVLNR